MGKRGEPAEKKQYLYSLALCSSILSHQGLLGYVLLSKEKKSGGPAESTPPNAETDDLQAKTWSGPSNLLRIHKARARLCPEIARQGLGQLGGYSSPLRGSNIFACRASERSRGEVTTTCVCDQCSDFTPPMLGGRHVEAIPPLPHQEVELLFSPRVYANHGHPITVGQ